MTLEDQIRYWKMGLYVDKINASNRPYVIKTKMSVSKYKSLTIYSKLQASRTALLLLSGGIDLYYVHYVKKFIDDVNINNRDIFVPENESQLNLCLIGEVTDFVKRRIVGKYDKLIVVGFSIGAVIGSHVLADITGIEKRLVCIDSPICISNMLSNATRGFSIWRPDILTLYKYTIRLATGSYSYKNILDILSLRDYEKYLEKHFGLTNYKYWSTMYPKIKDCDIVYLFNKQDPIIIYRENRPFIRRFRRRLHRSTTWRQYELAYDKPGHCTEFIEPNLGLINQIKTFL